MTKLSADKWEPTDALGTDMGADPADILLAMRWEMQLGQLREEFEAAREVAATQERYDVGDDLRLMTPEELLMFYPDGGDGWTWREEPAVIAARRYIIARDFNEFDPQRALMLWKLQNGGAL